MQNLRCKIHPHQPITNFCTRQQCQVQLCATCICHHTEMHGDNGTLPHYQNIYQTYRRAHEMVDSHRAQMDGQRKKIIQFNNNWEKKKQNVYTQVQNAKKDVLELVEKTFAEIKHKYIQAVHEEEIKIGMKSADKVLKMLQAHTIESDKLLGLQRQLAGVRGPETAKILFTTALPQSISFMQKIGTDFSALNAYDLALEYKQNQLILLKEQINGLLALNINWPQDLVSVPIVEVVERRSASIPNGPQTIYKTCSSGFYERPKSIGRPLKQVVVINGNSRLIIDNKPKISVACGKMSQSFTGNMNPMLAKSMKRTMIFPVDQTRIIR